MAVAESDARLIKKVVKAKPATEQSLEGYGYLIGGSRVAPPRKQNYYGNYVQVRKPAKFVSNADTSLSVATINPRPMQVRWMEYHNKHTQTFIPLMGKPFVAVLHRPTCRMPDGGWNDNGSLYPTIEGVEAFRFDGSAGFVMNIGTWHEFPFAVEENTNVIVILTNETTSNLDNLVEGEAAGGDLNKRDLQKRLGVVFEIEL